MEYVFWLALFGSGFLFGVGLAALVKWVWLHTLPTFTTIRFAMRAQKYVTSLNCPKVKLDGVCIFYGYKRLACSYGEVNEPTWSVPYQLEVTTYFQNYPVQRWYAFKLTGRF